MQQVKQAESKAKKVRVSPEEKLDLIRQQLKNHPVTVQAIFELNLVYPISALQLTQLNVSDINIKKNYIMVNRNGNVLYLLIPKKCAELLPKIINTATPGNTPLFSKNERQRLSLHEMILIKRLFN